MRKPRDFDQELKALTDKVRLLKERKIRQLGELVSATGADALEPETLSGALLAIVEVKDAAKKEAWRNRGRAFFRGRSRGKGGDGSEVGNSEAAAAPQPATRGNGSRDTDERGFANQQPEACATDRSAQPNAAGHQKGHSDETPC